MRRRRPETLSRGALIREVRRLAQTVRDTPPPRAEEGETRVEIEASRTRFADLYDLAPVACCTLDAEGRIAELNLAAAELFGAPREHLIGRTFAALAGVRDRRPLRAHLQRCVDGAEQVTTELRLHPPGAAPCTVELVSSTRQGVRTAGFRTAIVDISPAKEREEGLRFLARAGERLSSSLDYTTTLRTIAELATPDIADLCLVDIVDADGHLRRLEAVFGEAARQARLGEAMKAIELRPGWSSPQARVIASGEPMLLRETVGGVEGVAYHPRHAEVMLAAAIRSMMVVPLRTRGRVAAAITLARTAPRRAFVASDLLLAIDLAHRAAVALENARLYEVAQNAVRDRDALMALVAQDLKNPLGVILLKCEQALQRPVEDERRFDTRRQSQLIKRAALRMTRLISDLQDLACIEAGHFAIDARPEEAGALVDEALEMARPAALARAISLSAGPRPAGPTLVDCDRERILQVFDNLLGNAIKFTREGGAISTSVADGDKVSFAVTDDGPGIAPEDAAHVFDRFWQAKASARLGSGLGLSIAKGIVERHGGRIWVDPAPGHGSVFSFSLPHPA